MQVDTSFIENTGYKLSEFSVWIYSDRQKRVGRPRGRWKDQRPWKQNMELLLLMMIKIMFQLHKLYTVVWDRNGNLQDKLTRVLKQLAEAVSYFIVLSRQSPWRFTWNEDILPNSNIYTISVANPDPAVGSSGKTECRNVYLVAGPKQDSPLNKLIYIGCI